jgi:hypothetical protein
MIRCCDFRPVLITVLSILVLPFIFWGSSRTEAADFAGASGDRLLNFVPLKGCGEGAAGLELEPRPNASASGEAVEGGAGRHFMPPLRAVGQEFPAPAGRVAVPRAQEPDPELEWEKRYGGSYNDFIRFVQQTSDNGYIMVGDTYSPSNGGSDVYLVKTDSAGNVVWQKNFGGIGHDCGYCVRQTSDGGYILIGDTESCGNGGYDMYLIKVSASGNKQWENTFGGTGNDFGSSVWVNNDGTFILAGETNSFGTGGSDIYLVKVDATGTEIWGVYMDWAEHDWLASVRTTNDGGIVVAGGTMSFGAGSSDALLCKIDASGDTMLWGMVYGGTQYDTACDLELTSDGGFAVAGHTASFGAGSDDAYLIKADASGNMQWGKYYGGQYSDGAMSVRQTSDGGYLLGGVTFSYGEGNSNCYLVKTDSAGLKLWEKTHGGIDDDYGNCVILTSDGGFALAGDTYNTDSGWGDGLLVKYRAGGMAGDMNGDQTVNILDLLHVSRWLGPVSGPDSQKADFNGDGKVNILDLQAVAALVGQEPGPTEPVISDISPASGPAGTPVDIAGLGFGPSQGSSTVTFNGVAAPITAWSDNLIKVTVPEEAGSGDVVVTVGGKASNGVLFLVTIGEETVIYSETMQIGPAGGTITLGDGASMTVAPGALSVNTSLTFNKIGNERNFSGPYWLAYEVLGATEFLPGSMSVPVPPDLKPDPDRIGVLRYNPETLNGDTPSFNYDEQAGIITITTPSSAQLSKVAFSGKAAVLGQTGSPWKEFCRTIVELGKKATPVGGQPNQPIKMPFYEQVEGTCWAADAIMLSKAYTPYASREKEIEIYDYMKCMGIGINEGIGIVDFRSNLDDCFHNTTGVEVNASNWIFVDNLKDAMIKELDQGRPLILRYSTHTLLVTGYKTYMHGIRYMTDFQVHDSKGTNPPNNNEGTMYTWRNFNDWFVKEFNPDSDLVMINSLLCSQKNAPHPNRALQTIGLPSHDIVGQLGFVYNNDHGARIKIRLGFSENEPKGYAWYIVNDKTVSIPYRAEELYLNLPVWNADLDQGVAVRLEVKILQPGNTTPAYAHTEDITLGTDKDPHWFNKNIPVCSFSKSTGSNNYTLQVKLYRGSVYQDGYAVDFTMEEGPFICSLSTYEGEAGTAVTITGRGFGATQGSSEVTFNGVPAREIVSWSPTSIIARVPGGATNGNVAVAVEGKGSNGVPFEVKPIDLFFPVRISFVSGENHGVEEFNNRKGLIGLGAGATGLRIAVAVQNQYGGYDTRWDYVDQTQQSVREDTSYTLYTQDMVETVDMTVTGFLAKQVSESQTLYKLDECYKQTIQNVQIEGTVSNGRASGTIHCDRHDVNTCTSLDDSLYYNYSFVPDN